MLVFCLSVGLALTCGSAAWAADPGAAPSPAAAAPANAARSQVEQVLAEMSSAVLAADAKGYLKHVATDDAVFLKEQHNWAADLAKFKPEQFELSIRPDPSPTPEKPQWKDKPASFAPDRAAFTLVTRWTMPKSDSDAGPGGKGGRERVAEFPVVFTRGADGRWLYRGEDWQVLELLPGQKGAPEGFAGVRVKFDPALEPMARAVMQVMPEVRAHVDEGFENRIDRVQEVKLYNSLGHLQHSIYLSYSDPLGGWNEPHESIKLLGRAGRSGGAGLKTLLGHEYGHVATFEFGEKVTDAPWWVLEGVADLSGAAFRARAVERTNSRVVAWAREKKLAAWQDITDFRNTENRWMMHVYTQGEHMLLFISDQFGRAGRNRWLRALAAGKSLDDATRDALGLAFNDLDARWRAEVDKLLAAADAARKSAPEEPAGEKPDGEKPTAPKAPASPPA